MFGVCDRDLTVHSASDSDWAHETLLQPWESPDW